jgi:hypothetical protein
VPVIFQHVVHSIKTGEADCAEAITSEERSNGHPQECPTYAAPSRGVGTTVHRRPDVESGRGAGPAPGYHATAKTAAKWVHRYRALGAPGLLDRSSRPLRSPRRTSAQLAAQVIALRRQLRPAYQIAETTRLSSATVSRILQRAQLNRWRHPIEITASSGETI